jgi:hypothetical protein
VLIANAQLYQYHHYRLEKLVDRRTSRSTSVSSSTSTFLIKDEQARKAMMRSVHTTVAFKSDSILDALEN